LLPSDRTLAFRQQHNLRHRPQIATEFWMAAAIVFAEIGKMVFVIRTSRPSATSLTRLRASLTLQCLPDLGLGLR